MWRRSAQRIIVVALALLAAPLAVAAQPSLKAYRIGWLSLGYAPPNSNHGVGEFQQGLRDAGYVEGTNFTIVYRYASGKLERLPDLAAELVRLPVDVIVTSGEPAALAAKRATNTIPIVAIELAVDPVKAGLVASLGQPGGNVTGMATQSDELWQKRLGLLKQVVPQVSRVAVLWNPANPSNAGCVDEIKAVAPSMGMQLRLLEINDASALERAFAAVTNEPFDALATCWDSVILALARPIAESALKRRLPMLAPLKEFVEAGSLMSLGTSLPTQRRRAAYYVDRIFKGVKPAHLPIERPTQFDLVVNLTTAKTLGITLPPTVVLFADDVIQ